MNAKVKKYMKIKAALERLNSKKVEETVTEEKTVLQPEVKKEEPTPSLAELLPPVAEVATPVVEPTQEVVLEPVVAPVGGKKNKKVVEN